MTDEEEASESAECTDRAALTVWARRKGRSAWSRATVPLVAVMAAAAFGLSACGGGSTPGVASVGTTTTTAATAARGTSGGGTALRYAKCMRSHGVTNFPDPNSGGGFVFNKSSGIDPTSPQFQAAQARCQKFMPAGGLHPGATTHPTPEAMARMLKVSRCMHRHGITGFPEPRTSIPSDLRGIGMVSDRDTVILVFPSSLDLHSPAFTKAAAACGFALTDH